MRRPPSSARLEPRRSEAAVSLALTLAAMLLVCAVVLLDLSGSANAATAAFLRGIDPDSADEYPPIIDWAVRVLLLYPGIVCLVLAAAFTALAFASRFGPRWSVVTTGVACAAGTFVLLGLAALRAAAGMRIGDFEYFAVYMWLKEMSATWFAFATEIPLLATVLGLPAVGILLIRRHLRDVDSADRRARAGAPAPFSQAAFAVAAAYLAATSCQFTTSHIAFTKSGRTFLYCR
jgi:uncharacterized membrane protein